MVEDNKEINLVDHQTELDKQTKHLEDTIQLEQENTLTGAQVKEQEVEFDKVSMTCTIQKRNLVQVDALDTQRLESLKKLRMMAFFLKGDDETIANQSSTNFNENDMVHLKNMNEVNKKKQGKTMVNIMTSNINNWMQTTSIKFKTTL